MTSHTRSAAIHEAGRSVAELVIALSVASTMTALAVPSVRPATDQGRVESAARQLAGVMRDLRMDAARRRASVALDFSGDAGDVAVRCVVDGNGNGVRRADLISGLDVETCRPRRLGDDFPGVIFGTQRLVPDVDGESTIAPGERAVRFGASNLWSVSPSGTATSGTAYVSGPPDHHYAVRVLGATGRVRVLRFDTARRRWVAP